MGHAFVCVILFAKYSNVRQAEAQKSLKRKTKGDSKGETVENSDMPHCFNCWMACVCTVRQPCSFNWLFVCKAEAATRDDRVEALHQVFR